MRKKKDPFNLATKKSLVSIGRESLVQRFEGQPCGSRLKSA